MSRHERLTPEPVAEALPLRPQPADDATPARALPAETPAAAPPPPAPAVPPAAPKRGRRRGVLLVGLLAALSAGGWYGHEWWTNGRFLVETEDAYVQSDITLISSRVQGYVDRVLVSENDHVTAGQPLVQLDDGDYRIALDTARSKVATMTDTLATIDAQIAAARAAVEQARAGQDAAQATLTNAQAAAARTQSLTTRGVAPQSQLDETTAALGTATAGLAQAQAAVASAEAQVNVLTAQRAEAEGQKHQLELAVAQAQRDLDLTVLRAPASGTVANLSFELGDLVQPGARLAALVPDGSYYIEANYKETQLSGIVPGEKVHVTFDAIPGKEFEGRVSSAAPATGSVFSLLPADNATGNFTKVVQRVPVRIDLPEDALSDPALRAGLSAVVSVDSRTAPPAAGTPAPASE